MKVFRVGSRKKLFYYKLSHEYFSIYFYCGTEEYNILFNALLSLLIFLTASYQIIPYIFPETNLKSLSKIQVTD